MKKKLVALTMTAILGASMLAGCSSKPAETTAADTTAAQTTAAQGTEAPATEAPATEAPAGEKHLNVAWHSSLATISPAKNSWEGQRLGICETLTRINADLELVPWLAESWEKVDDLTWKITLREGVKFSNGKALDAEAVKAAFTANAVENSRFASLLNIESMEADGLVLTIKTAAVNAALPNNLADVCAVVYDAETLEGEAPMPVGTGPFAISEWDHESKMELVANKDYWGGTPKLEGVTVTVIGDGNAAAMALDNGEVDITFQLPTENVRQFEGNDNFTITKTTGSRSQIVYFNLENESLSDLAVRQAITMATDREALANIVNKGDSEAATAIFPVSYDFGKVEGIAYDVEAAKKVLADAGYADTNGDGTLDKDGKELSFRFITYGAHGSLLPTFAEAMQSALKEIGIAIEISTNEYAAHTDLLKSGDFDLALSSYIMAPEIDPQYFADILFTTESAYNYGKYSNETVNALVTELDAEFDTAKRTEIAIKAQEEIVKDCAWLTLGHLKYQVVANKKVSGYETLANELYFLNKDTDIN